MATIRGSKAKFVWHGHMAVEMVLSNRLLLVGEEGWGVPCGRLRGGAAFPV